jgi:cell wall-associated NlpC family hydrolase
VLTAAAAAAVALSSGAGSGSAQADTATSLAKAQKQVDGLREQAAAAGEQYNGALAERHRMQRQVNFAQNDVAAQQEAVNKQVEGMGAIAAAQYRDGGLDQTVGMLTAKDPTDYLDRASSVRQVDRAQAGMLSQLQGKQQSLTRARDEAATALAAQQQQTQRMADARRTAQQKLAQAQQVLQKLTAQQREELARKAAEERAAQLAAAQQAARQEAAQQTAAQQAANSGSGGSSSSASGSVGEQALAAAKTKIGSPYVWAAAGPSSFDCSGLVQWAYAQVGISLPHYSYTDETVGSAVNGLANAEPGDIVVMLDGEHVGMYAGKNSSGQYMILHAPYPGAYVRLESIDTIGSVTAVRRM